MVQILAATPVTMQAVIDELELRLTGSGRPFVTVLLHDGTGCVSVEGEEPPGARLPSPDDIAETFTPGQCVTVTGIPATVRFNPEERYSQWRWLALTRIFAV